jgi:CHAT domain-containing protein
LLASHWEVDSNTTVRLMTGMFAKLGSDFARQGAGRDGTGIAAALRQSQVGLLDQPATSHPFFWAAFAVIGDGGAVAPGKAVAAAAQ